MGSGEEKRHTHLRIKGGELTWVDERGHVVERVVGCVVCRVDTGSGFALETRTQAALILMSVFTVTSRVTRGAGRKRIGCVWCSVMWCSGVCSVVCGVEVCDVVVWGV